jgi:transcriptional regulator with XRE-family HTH domain
MSLKSWEAKVLGAPGAPERIQAIEDELRLAVGLTALREEAGLSQREVARRMGVSQPRVAAIERSHNVTIEVLEQYVNAVGGVLEVRVVKGTKMTQLLSSAPPTTPTHAAAKARRGVRIGAGGDVPQETRSSRSAAGSVTTRSTAARPKLRAR